jgi:hypothetical protein
MLNEEADATLSPTGALVKLKSNRNTERSGTRSGSADARGTTAH